MALMEEGKTLLLVSRRVPSMSRASRRMSLLHSACRLPEEPAEKNKGVYALQQSQKEPPKAAARSYDHRPYSPMVEKFATLCVTQL